MTTRLAEDLLSPADFAAIAALLHRTAGITLGDNKRELVVGRLNRRLRALGLKDFAAYRALLEGPDGESERGEMVNALTTNLTSFFREKHHFEYLATDVLPPLLKGSSRRLRLWSAACSSGEEPYSIAMTLHKALANRGTWDAKILATDIDTNMVTTGEAGIYDVDRTRTVPPDHARLMSRERQGQVEMSDTLKDMIAFRPLNLLRDWPMRGKFDVIFCRNVVIYFDKDTQRKLFDRFADIMTPDGYLFIGHSESLFRVCDRFANLGKTIYRKIR